MRLTNEEFRFVKNMAYDKFGIFLTDKKKSLIESRFSNIVTKKGYESFMPYFKNLSNDISGEEMTEFVNRLTTNHTYFFREEKHFDLLKNQVLPKLLKEEHNTKDLRIWSAGCSSGEEAFTLAMIIDELLGKEKGLWDTKILATDISSRVLEKAHMGIYPKESLEKIDYKYIQKYFETHPNGYRITASLRSEVIFRKFNLTHEFRFKKPFNIIFCRNVLIYFDKASKQSVLAKFHHYLKPGGYLFIGHSETMEGVTSGFKFIQPSVYQKL